MAEPIQIVEEEVMLEGMPALESASLYVELATKRNGEIQSNILETMRSLKKDLERLKEDNIKLMNAKSNQEEIHDLSLKGLIDPSKNNGQNSHNTRNKRKGAVQSCNIEETTNNILVTIWDLKRGDKMNPMKQKEKTIEL